MKKYRFSGNIDKLLYQNDGEIIDCIEGCLIDNYLISTKRGYIALIEAFVNSWTSDYTLYFSTDIEDVNNAFNHLREVI